MHLQNTLLSDVGGVPVTFILFQGTNTRTLNILCFWFISIYTYQFELLSSILYRRPWQVSVCLHVFDFICKSAWIEWLIPQYFYKLFGSFFPANLLKSFRVTASHFPSATAHFWLIEFFDRLFHCWYLRWNYFRGGWKKSLYLNFLRLWFLAFSETSEGLYEDRNIFQTIVLHKSDYFFWNLLIVMNTYTWLKICWVLKIEMWFHFSTTSDWQRN